MPLRKTVDSSLKPGRSANSYATCLKYFLLACPPRRYRPEDALQTFPEAAGGLSDACNVCIQHCDSARPFHAAPGSHRTCNHTDRSSRRAHDPAKPDRDGFHRLNALHLLIFPQMMTNQAPFALSRSKGLRVDVALSCCHAPLARWNLADVALGCVRVTRPTASFFTSRRRAPRHPDPANVMGAPPPKTSHRPCRGRCHPVRHHDADALLENDTMVLAYRVAAVPEPESFAMLIAGLGLVGAIVRRRRAR